MRLNKGERDSLNVLGTAGETQYWTLLSASLQCQLGEFYLRRFLRRLDTDVAGVSVFWDVDVDNSGDYDFAVHICQSCFLTPTHQDKFECTCG